jgi:hypothetical protein
MDVQGENTLLEIIKWVGIVLAAGFIGYFGRYLAMLIIDRIRRRKSPPLPATGQTAEIFGSPDIELETTRLKLEKKKAKAEAKQAKKTSKQ